MSDQEKVEYNGHWAVLTQKPLTWGDRNALRSQANKDFWVDFAPALVTWAVESWSYDTDPKDRASWENADPEFGDRVFAAALSKWKAAAERETANPTPEPSES